MLKVSLVAIDRGNDVRVREDVPPESPALADTGVVLTEPLQGDGEDDDGGGEVYPLPVRGTELDLTEAVREQLLLQVPAYVLCREACAGLCPRCGADRNDGECGCAPPDEGSPWAALKKLTFD